MTGESQPSGLQHKVHISGQEDDIEMETVCLNIGDIKITFLDACGNPSRHGSGKTLRRNMFTIEGPGIDPLRVKRVTIPPLDYSSGELLMVKIEMYPWNPADFVPQGGTPKSNTENPTEYTCPTTGKDTEMAQKPVEYLCRYKIGDHVKVGPLYDEDAVVIGILIRSGGITYECATINSFGERKSDYFSPAEIHSKGTVRSVCRAMEDA